MMLISNLERAALPLLAAKEWNESQRSVVESFQNTQGSDDRSIYLIFVLFATVVILAAYTVIKRIGRRR